jgi:hypothetical protein
LHCFAPNTLRLPDDALLVVQGPSDVLRQLQKVRGLRNEDGQNNCFVNVIIQSLWHLESFRYSLLSQPMPPALEPSSRACNGMAPSPAAAAGGAQKAATSHASPAEADVNVMLALRRIFHALNKPLPSTASATPSSSSSANASTGSSSSSSSSSAPGQSAADGWLVSPAELREALSALDKGAAAIEINESEMHDASEVLGEVLSALHRAEVGRAKLPSEDPQLPRRVKVAGDALGRVAMDQHKGPHGGKAAGAAAEQQAGVPKALTLAGILQNGRGGGVTGMHKANGVSSAAAAGGGAADSLQLSLVHKLFGLDVQVPAPIEEATGGQQQKGSQAGAAAAEAATASKGRKKGAAGAAAAAAAGGIVSPGAGAAAGAGKSLASSGAGDVKEVFQFMKFFHLVPAQVRHLALQGLFSIVTEI